MKIKYSGVVELDKAEQEFSTQLRTIKNWNSQITERLQACLIALDAGVLSANDMPEKISDIRVSLYEVDKSLEILNTNYTSYLQTQTKEDNDKAGNREQHEQTSPVSNGQGSKD